MQLSVIIVSYNVKHYLEQCLHALLLACNTIETEIIVVDNASADNSVDYLQPKFPLVNFIQNKQNTGFAKANNIALKIAKGNYILYLNPDTIVAENTITDCISFFENDKNAGAIGVKMVDGNGNFLPESKRSFPSLSASFWKLSGMANLFPRSSVFNKYALGNLDENKVAEVDVLSGAFFLSTKNLLLALNGFDEAFFMYGEDIDLSYRVQKAGFKNYYVGNSSIIHFKGESTQKNKKDYVNNFYGAMKIFVEKHHKNASTVFLKAAIDIAAVTLTFGKKIKGRLSSSTIKNAEDYFLYGDENAVASAAKVLSANDFTFKILNFNEAISVAVKSISNQSIKPNLIFCIDELTAAECIAFMQENKNRFLYYWHYKGSLSIVSGSASAATPQIYIP